jgi:hypothetical protein
MCPHTPPCPAPSAPDREAAIILSGIWLAAGVVAYLIWARVVRTWPFGPKLVREVYLDQQKQQLAAAGPPPQPQ